MRLTSSWTRYGLALAAFSSAFGVCLLLDPIPGNYAPYLPFALAVMVAGTFGGRGPALAATLASVVCTWYFLLPPRDSFAIAGVEHVIGLVLSAAVGSGIALLSGRLHRALAVSGRSELQLRLFIESAPVAMAMFDREMRYLAVSQRYIDDYHLENHPLGRSHYDVFPEIPERWKEVHQRVLAGVSEGAVEDYFDRTTGRRTWLRWEMRPWYQAGGSLSGAVLATEDITATKEAEAALRHSEERFRTLFENAGDGIFISGARGTFVEVNERALELVGYTREELLKLRLSDLLHPSARRRLLQEASRLRDGAQAVAEWSCVRKDGSTFTGEVSARVLPGGNLLGIVRDVTERRRLEAQFLQAQKLEGIGRLAGGVAHDFNNLLTVISGYARMGLEDLSAEHPLREPLIEIDKASARAATLTRQLLAFSRNQVFEARTVVVDEVIRDFEKMLRRIIGEDIELSLILRSDDAVIRTEAGRIEQILLNLVVNSRDAMPFGGRLVLETSRFQADPDFAALHVDVSPGSYIYLKVSDNGSGMSADVKSHAFEPFFTTKGPGQGTGLGLSTVYGIIKQSGGAIWIDSEPGSGCTFHLLFPLAAPAREETAATARRVRGSGTILLVEDEPEVRKYLRQALQRNGYTVLEARNGREGLEIARANERSIQLLLTDMVMPKMGGTQLIAQFSSGGRDIPILCMSGYADRELRTGEAGVAFIQKPFSIEALLNRVDELISRPRN